MLAGIVALVSAVVAVTWRFGSAGIELSAVLGVSLLFRPVHLGLGIRGLAVVGVAAFVALLGLLDRLMSGGLWGTVVSVLAMAVVGYPLIFAGIWLSQAENVQRQRYRDRAAGRIQAQLARGRKPQYSLYLRPFATQDRMGTAAVGEMIHTSSGGQGIVNVQTDMEAILASAFSVRRPLIGAGQDGRLLTAATDQPSGSLVPDIPGVGKFACTEDDWEDKVTQAAENAELIVVVPLAYEGTLWEIDWLSSASLLSRTVFVMPPTRSSGHDYGPEWNRGIDALADLGITVPPYNPEGGTFLYRNADLTTPLFFPRLFWLPPQLRLRLLFLLVRQAVRADQRAGRGTVQSPRRDRTEENAPVGDEREGDERARVKFRRRAQRMWAGALPPDGQEIPVELDGTEGKQPCDLLTRGQPVVILGEPGAGKSTLLVRTFDEWPDDESVPVPLHVGSWPVHVVPFEDWLAGELTGPLYRLPRGAAERWIASSRVVPLLDGVDELPVSRGRACLRAVASYARRNQVPYAACCRTSSYTALASALDSPAVVTLRPLDDARVASYLEKAGATGLSGTAGIAELLSTPFHLRAATVAYAGAPPITGSQEQLLTRYVDQALSERGQAWLRLAGEASRRKRFLRPGDAFRPVAPGLPRWAVLPRAAFGALLVAPCLYLLASPPIAFLAGHRGAGPLAAAAAAAGALTALAALLKNRRGVPEAGDEGRRLRLASTAAAAGTVYGMAVLIPAFFVLVAAGLYLQGRHLLGGPDPHFSDTLGFVLAAVLVLSPPILPLALILSTSLDEPAQRRIPDASSHAAALWSASDVTLVTTLVATAALLPAGAPIWLGPLTGLTAGYLTHGHLLLTTLCERAGLITSGVLPLRPRAFLNRSAGRGLILRVGPHYHIASRLLLDHLTSTQTPI